MSDEDHHAEFVSTREGTGQLELFVLCGLSVLCIFIRNTLLPWIFLGRRFDRSRRCFWTKYAVDYCILVVPPLLATTFYAADMYIIFWVLVAALCLVLFLVFCEYLHATTTPAVKHVLNRIIDEQHHPSKFFTYTRAIMFIFINIAILAVDFPVFPRKFAKTVAYGHSLMDIGVAAVAYMMGMTSSLRRIKAEKEQGNTVRKTAWYTSPPMILFAIGVGRTTVLTLLQYPQHVSEYGVHWNFFFTIGVMKLVDMILPRRFPILLAVFFAALHQLILSSGYEEWILEDGKNDRSTLFAANAEGIVSLTGYLTIFYAAMTIGKFIANTGIRIKSWLHRTFHLFLYAAIFLMIQHFLAEPLLGKPSRRVVNLPYIVAQMSLLTFCCAATMTVQMFNIFAWAAGVPQLCYGEDPFYSVEPCLAVSLNRQTLVSFLLANVLTGLTNMTINTHETSDDKAMAVLVVYSIIFTVLPYYQQYRTSKMFVDGGKTE